MWNSNLQTEVIGPKNDAVAWEEPDEVPELLLDHSDEENMTKSGDGKLRWLDRAKKILAKSDKSPKENLNFSERVIQITMLSAWWPVF